MPFDEFLEKRLFEPLGMKDAGFWVPPGKAGRLATVYWAKDGKLRPLDEAHGHPEGGILVQPWSVNSYTVNHKHKGGSFGLVSTTEDYWRFAQMMLNGGVLNGTRVLGPQVVHFMTRDHLGTIPIDEPGEPASGIGFGLGFGVVKDAGERGGMLSDGSYFWGGAADTTFWIDPKQDLVVVAMTQHMDVPDAGLGALGALVYSALME
jgi:CubicO group peptidase (beta-lactamase class C family)